MALSSTDRPPGATGAPVTASRTAAEMVRRRRVIRLAGLVGLLALVVAVLFVSLAVGAKPIPLGTVWDALFRPDGGEDSIIIRELRVPRTVLGLLIGMALGTAGALIQGHTRNPLADPGLLGVSAGAAFAVVLAIFAFGLTSLSVLVWFAFAGALLASIAVFLIGALGGGGATPITLALAGAALTALLGSFTTAMTLLDTQTLDSYRFWVVGSLAGRDGDVAVQVAPFLIVGLLLALLNTSALNMLGLGEDVARALGQNIALARVVGVASITLLAGAATAACGPIAFVGLVVPHVARIFTGPDYRWLVPYSALLGVILLLVADIIGRIVVRPGELQVGIVLALVGGPFFIYLVRRRRLAAL